MFGRLMRVRAGPPTGATAWRHKFRRQTGIIPCTRCAQVRDCIDNVRRRRRFLPLPYVSSVVTQINELWRRVVVVSLLPMSSSTAASSSTHWHCLLSPYSNGRPCRHPAHGSAANTRPSSSRKLSSQCSGNSFIDEHAAPLVHPPPKVSDARIRSKRHRR